MQRLTYPRTFAVPVKPNTRELIAKFYQSPPRSWKLDESSKSVFQLKFFRGNWSESKTPKWLAKTALSKLIGARRPLPPSTEGAKVAMESWPAELSVAMKTVEGNFEISLSYEVTMVGDNNAMSRDAKKKWKAAVEEDAYALYQRLTEQAASR